MKASRPLSPCAGPNSAAVTGILKGYDQLLNLVLDEVTEELQCASPLLFAVSRLFSLATSARAPCALSRPHRPPRAHHHRAQPCRRLGGNRQSLPRRRTIDKTRPAQHPVQANKASTLFIRVSPGAFRFPCLHSIRFHHVLSLHSIPRQSPRFHLLSRLCPNPDPYLACYLLPPTSTALRPMPWQTQAATRMHYDVLLTYFGYEITNTPCSPSLSCVSLLFSFRTPLLSELQ